MLVLILHLSLLVLAVSAEIKIQLSDFIQDPTKDDLTKDSISLKQKVLGHETTMGSALDGNINSAFVNREAFESMTGVDLGAVYDIQEISLYVKNLKDANRVPFTMLLHEKFSMSDHRDDYEESVKLLRNFKFTGASQQLKLTLSGVQGQYLTFVDQDPFIFKLPRHQAFQINEIVVRGRKVRESSVMPLVFHEDWDKVPAKFKQWRYGKSLTEGVPEMWTDRCQRMIPVTLNQACVFGYQSSCTGISGMQGKGKFLATTSGSLMREVLDKGLFSRLKSNLEAWMCPKCTGLSQNKFEEGKITVLDVNSPYSPKEVREHLDKGYPAIILISHWAKHEEYKLCEELDLGLLDHLAVWKRHPMQVNADCKDLLPVDVLFGLMSGPVKDLLNVKFSFNVDMFQMNPTRKRLNDGLRDKIKELIENLHGIGPSIYNVLKGREAVSFMSFLLRSIRPLFKEVYPYPILSGTSQFPPSPSGSAQRSTATVTVTTYSGHQRISTGLGARRGQAFSYKVIEGDIGNWQVLVGSRQDGLYHLNELKRLPSVVSTFNMKSSDTVYPINAGLIQLYLKEWLGIEGKGPRRITVEFTNVYRTAVYDRRLPNPWEYWTKTYKKTEFPIAEIGGEIISQNVILTHMAESSREDIEEIAQLLDKWYIINMNVRGTDWFNNRGEMFVYDVQISAGWGHSGYPLMGHLPWHLPSSKKVLEEGAWGHCHELGHNYQQDSWKLPNTGEVTNNLFCIYDYNMTLNMHTFTVPGVWFGDKELNQLKNHWKTENWPADMYQLNYYQFFNWQFGRGFWANTINFLNNVEKEKPDFNHLEYLVYAMSKKVGYDFSPYHQLYNMPLGEAVKKATKEFGDCWMPKQEFTAEVEDKIAKIEAEHGKKCTRATKVIQIDVDLQRNLDLVRKDRVKATLQEASGQFCSGFVPKKL